MKKLKVLLFILTLLFTIRVNAANPQKDTLVVIKTVYGTIKIKLYEDTPLHRRNFIHLVQTGFYDSTLFHRVIPNFMIQGGDPTSKHAAPGAMLGNGDPGYTIPAEFRINHYHKKGALAAAREGDDVNPSKASSGCQFYIVQGRKFTEQDMTGMEIRMNNSMKQGIFQQYMGKPENESLRNRFIANQQTHNSDSLAILSKSVQPYVDAEYAKMAPFKYTEEQKKGYAEDGGAPHLDGGYTVFGEVVEGLDVIDRIASVECDGANRPKDDIKMIVMLEY